MVAVENSYRPHVGDVNIAIREPHEWVPVRDLHQGLRQSVTEQRTQAYHLEYPSVLEELRGKPDIIVPVLSHYVGLQRSWEAAEEELQSTQQRTRDERDGQVTRPTKLQKLHEPRTWQPDEAFLSPHMTEDEERVAVQEFLQTHPLARMIDPNTGDVVSVRDFVLKTIPQLDLQTILSADPPLLQEKRLVAAQAVREVIRLEHHREAQKRAMAFGEIAVFLNEQRRSGNLLSPDSAELIDRLDGLQQRKMHQRQELHEALSLIAHVLPQEGDTDEEQNKRQQQFQILLTGAMPERITSETAKYIREHMKIWKLGTAMENEHKDEFIPLVAALSRQTRRKHLTFQIPPEGMDGLSQGMTIVAALRAYQEVEDARMVTQRETLFAHQEEMETVLNDFMQKLHVPYDVLIHLTGDKHIVSEHLQLVPVFREESPIRHIVIQQKRLREARGRFLTHYHNSVEESYLALIAAQDILQAQKLLSGLEEKITAKARRVREGDRAYRLARRKTAHLEQAIQLVQHAFVPARPLLPPLPSHITIEPEVLTSSMEKRDLLALELHTLLRAEEETIMSLYDQATQQRKQALLAKLKDMRPHALGDRIRELGYRDTHIEVHTNGISLDTLRRKPRITIPLPEGNSDYSSLYIEEVYERYRLFAQEQGYALNEGTLKKILGIKEAHGKLIFQTRSSARELLIHYWQRELARQAFPSCMVEQTSTHAAAMIARQLLEAQIGFAQEDSNIRRKIQRAAKKSRFHAAA